MRQLETLPSPKQEVIQFGESYLMKLAIPIAQDTAV